MSPTMQFSKPYAEPDTAGAAIQSFFDNLGLDRTSIELWIATALYLGKSTVTASRISIYFREDKI
ncbi:MAG: hypothetical protein L7F77_13775 [Candidatus Magnetominusculus sp. LBB02]|nr:hypothetical protein [Candidatus Magnetominusculus sp. LBB02]